MDTLHKFGKDFNWKKPNCCPRCHGKLHGHGFATAYFAEYQNIFYIKRYRCPCCKLIIRMRPQGYTRRIRSSINKIYEVLKYKIINATWPYGFSRQRGGHWLRVFILKLHIFKGYSQKNLIESLEEYFIGGLNFLKTVQNN
jgi:hypothetical protein